MSATDQASANVSPRMDITEATKENDATPNMMAESNMMVDRDEDTTRATAVIRAR